MAPCADGRAVVILVTGATGNVGGELVKLLGAGGVACRALSRRPEALSNRPDLEVVRGDLGDSASLADALVDVDRVFLMAPGHQLPVYARNLSEAAVHQGVRHVVLLSSSAVETDSEDPVCTEHRLAEDAVTGSGLDWTLLRPGAFSSNALMWSASIRTEGIARALFGNAPAAPIDPYDIAAVAAVVLTAPGHERRAYSLTGAERLTSRAQVEVIADVLGRSIDFEELSVEQAVIALRQLYPDPADAEAVIVALRQPNLPWSEPLPTVEQITGVAPRRFRTWVEIHCSMFEAPTSAQ